MRGDQHAAALDYLNHLQGTAGNYPNIANAANAAYVDEETANNLILNPGITIGGQFADGIPMPPIPLCYVQDRMESAQDPASHLMAAPETRLEDSSAGETIITLPIEPRLQMLQTTRLTDHRQMSPHNRPLPSTLRAPTTRRCACATIYLFILDPDR